MTRIMAVVLLLITAIGALYGGINMIIYPSGESLQIPLEILNYSPFSDFFIPGLILFIVLGLGSLITSMVIFRKTKGYPFLTIFMGFAISIWISVQILMLREVHYLQITFAAIGIILIILGIILRQKEYA